MKPIRITMGNKLIAAALLAFCSMNAAPLHAQFFKKLQQKLEDKVSNKADDVLSSKKKSGDTTTEENTTGSGKKVSGKLPYEEDIFTFTPGANLYYSDSLTNETVGRMPHYWKTHSTGAVAVIPDVPGKWLKMTDKSSYRIDSLLPMPKNFTMQFDLLTRSEEAQDLADITFGFNSDNSASTYVYGFSDNTSAYSQLAFYYKNIRSRSNETRTNNDLDFPLNNFGNAIIHISMVVEGEHMRLYFNKCKMLDADMFEKTTAKYFFISTDNMSHKANVYISNLRIARI